MQNALNNQNFMNFSVADFESTRLIKMFLKQAFIPYVYLYLCRNIAKL